jgi:hypothetical protein
MSFRCRPTAWNGASKKANNDVVDTNNLVDGKRHGRLKIGVSSRKVTLRVKDDAFRIYGEWVNWLSTAVNKCGGGAASALSLQPKSATFLITRFIPSKVIGLSYRKEPIYTWSSLCFLAFQRRRPLSLVVLVVLQRPICGDKI